MVCILLIVGIQESKCIDISLDIDCWVFFYFYAH